MAIKKIEKGLESAVFNSRWLMAPFYLGLIVSLVVLLVKFVLILGEFVTHAWGASESDVVLGVLQLVDFCFTGNLIVIIIFSGYENFVSRIDAADHPDWPEWMAKIDFSGLKQKLLASIVAISAIQVLKAFMNIETGGAESNTKLAWLVGIHIVFVLSTLLLAWADKLGGDHH